MCMSAQNVIKEFIGDNKEKCWSIDKVIVACVYMMLLLKQHCHTVF